MKNFAGPLCFALCMMSIDSARAVSAAEPAPSPSAVEAPIKRFSQVAEQLYRGGQPDSTDFTYLRDLGIRTIISFRDEDNERPIVESLGMKFVHIPVTFTPLVNYDLPPRAVERFFAVIDDPTSGPVFVHCKRGADRTGAFVGLYRVLRQNWSVERAYQEARAIGMRWWYSGVKDQLAERVKALSVPTE